MDGRKAEASRFFDRAADQLRPQAFAPELRQHDQGGKPRPQMSALRVVVLDQADHARQRIPCKRDETEGNAIEDGRVLQETLECRRRKAGTIGPELPMDQRRNLLDVLRSIEEMIDPKLGHVPMVLSAGGQSGVEIFNSYDRIIRNCQSIGGALFDN
jgi:hypothetical protein